MMSYAIFLKYIKKAFQLPLIKILSGILICYFTLIIGNFLAGKIMKIFSANENINNIISIFIVTLLVLYVYFIFFKFLEKRKIEELSKNTINKSLFFGILLGFILQAITIFIIYLVGGFKIISINPFSFLIPSFMMAFKSSIFEEILFRGILFRIVEEKLGSYISLLISAVFFGIVHLANDNSSISSTISVALNGGILLAAAFIYSRNLWFPIAIHFSWNFSLSGIFGANTSGEALSTSLMTTEIHGNKLLTGGFFGPENSIQTTLICLAVSSFLIYLSIKEHKIIKPYWNK